MTEQDGEVGFKVLRRFLDNSGWGFHFHDPDVQNAVDTLITEVDSYRAAAPPVDPPPMEESKAD